MTIITPTAVVVSLRMVPITVILMCYVKSLPSFVFDESVILYWSWSKSHGLRFLPWHHSLILWNLKICSRCVMFLFSEIVGTSLRSSWKWPPFIPSFTLRLCIYIRAHILRCLSSLFLLGHTMLIKSIVHIVRLRWLSITWGPSTPISFLLNYLLWSMVNLWLCLNTIFCLFHWVSTFIKFLIDSSVPVQVSLGVWIDNIITSNTKPHLILHVMILRFLNGVLILIDLGIHYNFLIAVH